MFDIDEYYNDSFCSVSDRIESGNLYENLEEDIADDIHKIIKNPVSSLYEIDRFRQNKHSIDIFYPSKIYDSAKGYLKTPNKIRFELSTYPFEEDLGRISRIVIRPRHIEESDMELMGLYIPENQIVVLYLHYPANFFVKDQRLSQANLFMPYNISTINNHNILGKSSCSSHFQKVSPMFYIISTIAKKSGNDIDKFFIKMNNLVQKDVVQKLNDISGFYSKYGY